MLVTDGQETTSSATLAQAIKAARAAHALIYPIGIESSAFSPRDLRELARKTGGTFYGAASSAELTRIYTHLSQQLRRTWSLDYLTSARPGQTVRARVSVAGLGSATSSFNVPGSVNAAHGSGLSITMIAALILLLAVLAIVATPLTRAVRSGALWPWSDTEF